MISYGAIGAACACICNFIVIVGSLTGFEYWNTAALSFVLVTPLGYVLQSWFTFGVKLSARGFVYFTGSVAVGAVLFVALIGLFHGAFGVPVWIASPLATVTILCWNYTAASWLIGSVIKGKLRFMAPSRFLTKYKSSPTTLEKRLRHD